MKIQPVSVFAIAAFLGIASPVRASPQDKEMKHDCMAKQKDGKMCDRQMMEKCEMKMSKGECKKMRNDHKMMIKENQMPMDSGKNKDKKDESVPSPDTRDK